MGGSNSSYAPENNAVGWYVAEYSMSHEHTVRFTSDSWRKCMNFIILAFDRHASLNKTNLENDLIKYGCVERYIDHSNFLLKLCMMI
jgi:hypothetical protein